MLKHAERRDWERKLAEAGRDSPWGSGKLSQRFQRALESSPSKSILIGNSSSSLDAMGYVSCFWETGGNAC